MANLNSAEVWSAVKRAAAVLIEQKIHYVLMGTAALAAHGIKPREVPDVDFMVERYPSPVPKDFEELLTANGSKDRGTYLVPSGEFSTDVKVDYVLAETSIEKGFLNEKSVKVDDDIVAMTVDTALGIKRWKGRQKDFEFLKLVKDFEFLKLVENEQVPF
jgi:hypothetical protein